MLTRNPDLQVKDLVGTHVAAKEILKPDTAAAKRAAIFGKKTA